MRLVCLVSLVLICAMPGRAAACSCMSPELQRSYESSRNVFTAVVTGARFDGDGNIEAGFEVTETFKGDVPFDKLRTTRSGTSCDTSITVGPEYLFFMGDEGRFGGCSVRPTVESAESWLEILRAYKAGETSDLSSPWTHYDRDGSCSLRSDFRTTADALRGEVRLEYRYAVPENPAWAIENMNEVGYANAVFIMPTHREPAGAEIMLKTTDREFVAKWSDDALPGRSRGAFQLAGHDVRDFARELLLASEVQVDGALTRYPSLDGTVIRTTNAGDAISGFVDCANQ